MSSIHEVKATLLHVCNELLPREPIQKAIHDLDSAIARLQATTAGSDDGDAQSAICTLMSVRDTLSGAQSGLNAASDSVETYAGRI